MRGLKLRFWTHALVIGLLAAGGCAGTGGADNGNDNGNTNTNTNDNGGQNTNDNVNDNGGDNGNDNAGDTQAALYVVNNDGGGSVTFYNNAESLDGEITPDGEVEAGAATSLFQPRSVVVTNSGRLLVSRQNGGIVGYNNATALSETTPADLVVDGNNTLLESPIAFAYDALNDRLFVGNINGTDGILVFDNVSQAGFNGEIAPDRTFGPPDRAPFDNPPLTIDAMHIDAGGNLYVSDSEGDITVNSNRILVFANASAATGSVTPSRTINSNDWGKHEDIFVDDVRDVLYVVDAASVICIFAGASTLDGTLSPSSTIQVNVALANLQGIVVTRDGVGLVADRESSAIFSFDDIANRVGLLTPDRSLGGFETQLRGPRQLWLVETDQ